MSTEIKDLTPNPSGTESTDLTPDPGTESSQPDGAATSPSSPPPEQSWEDRYKASSREVNRIRNEAEQAKQQAQQLAAQNAQYAAYLAQLQAAGMQQRTEPPPAETTKKFVGLTKEEQVRRRNAILDQDYDTIAEIDGLQAQRIADHAAEVGQTQIVKHLMGMAQEAQKTNSSLGALNSYPELNDPQSPFTQKTAQNYMKMVNDPSLSWVPQAQVRLGNATVNPHVLQMAAERTRLEMNTSKKEGEMQRSGEYFTEPSDRPGQSTKSNSFNPNIHLSPEERAAANDRGQSYSDYWKYIPEENKSARLKAGKYVKGRAPKFTVK